MAELPVLLQRTDGFLWLDIPEWSDDAEAVLARNFGFHPMAISESRNRNHIPRLHVYPDHVFIVVHAPEIGARGHVHYLELDQFVGEIETRMTQPSRDGGVDCVAFDNRAIFGGKVIIQAKRYKNTVPVSAVRDLFGSVHNEGATKGILVTTSGYGKASFEFANDKPLELLSGTNLLYLLKKHAGVDAKIEPPEHWIDPKTDTGPAHWDEPPTST